MYIIIFATAHHEGSENRILNVLELLEIQYGRCANLELHANIARTCHIVAYFVNKLKASTLKFSADT